MKRRAFMATAASIASGAAWSSAASGAHAVDVRLPMSEPGTDDEVAALADHLLQAFPEPASLQVIGEAHRRDRADRRGQAGSPLTLLPEAFQDVLRHLDLSRADLQRMTPAALRTCIDARTARDFSAGRIIGVEGWLLGETEARLCEVAALRAG